MEGGTNWLVICLENRATVMNRKGSNPSLSSIFGPLDQLAESQDLKSSQFRFESEKGYQNFYAPLGELA